MRRTGNDEADIRREADALLADDHRIGDQLQHAPGKCLGIGEARSCVAENDPEFIGAQPGDHVAPLSAAYVVGYYSRNRARSGSFKQPIGNGLQHAIANPRTVEIVDTLEIVDVEKKHRHTVAASPDSCQRRAQTVEKTMAAGSPGQPIGGALRICLGDDVVQRRDNAEDAAIAAESGANADGAMMKPPGRIPLDATAPLDNLPAQGTPLQIGNLGPGGRIEFVMALPVKH